MSSSKNTTEAVLKVLGEPVFAEFSDNVWKIRTNLILASVISIAVVFGDLHIEPDSQILGLKFKGLTDAVLTNGLIAVVSYLLLHFVWTSIDALLEWRLRITGTRVAYVTTARLASADGDYPNDPRQSTLYNWWKSEARNIGHLRAWPAEVDARLSEWETALKAKFSEGADALNITETTKLIASIRDDMMRLTSRVEAVSKAIESARIPVSLRRFDAWYGLFLRSQNLRWLLIDFLAPVIAGSYALALLVSR